MTTKQWKSKSWYDKKARQNCEGCTAAHAGVAQAINKDSQTLALIGDSPEVSQLHRFSPPIFSNDKRHLCPEALQSASRLQIRKDSRRGNGTKGFQSQV
eukprot:3331816-Amphidinium_carterae.1